MKKIFLSFFIGFFLVGCSQEEGKNTTTPETNKPMETITFTQVNDSETFEGVLTVKEEDGKLVFKTFLKNLTDETVTIEHADPMTLFALYKNSEILTNREYRINEIAIKKTISGSGSLQTHTYTKETSEGEYEGNVLIQFSETSGENQSINIPFEF